MEEAPIDTIETVSLFSGEGVRLDGKKKKDNQLDEPVIRKVSLVTNYLLFDKIMCS